MLICYFKGGNQEFGRDWLEEVFNMVSGYKRKVKSTFNHPCPTVATTFQRHILCSDN